MSLWCAWQSLLHWVMERGVVALMVPAVHHGSKHGARYFKADHVVQALAVAALPCAAEVAPHICLDPP